MKLVIVTGLSGSGKSIALHMLEDLGYYCIDNLPVGMLDALADQITGDWGGNLTRVAVGIDVRSPRELHRFPDLVDRLKARGIEVETIFLHATDDVLLKRFSETRRRHPLTNHQTSLGEAIAMEHDLLKPVAACTTHFIDTSETTIHQLRELIRQRVDDLQPGRMSLLLLSFGFKHGVPTDADFVFDVRCLPNPHWDPALRPQTGRDPEVQAFLESTPDAATMVDRLERLFEEWIPSFLGQNRNYLTIAIGCTGGQHRSVYVTERLADRFRRHWEPVIVRHRELER
ncbi:MAG TPA: RNase adapter RapZ [Thiotrichales bacterium]|nr:RNase adapter RapZ [Thiotrichales bacterium]